MNVTNGNGKVTEDAVGIDLCETGSGSPSNA